MRATVTSACFFPHEIYSQLPYDVGARAELVTTQSPTDDWLLVGQPEPEVAAAETTEAFAEGATSRNAQHRRRTSRELELHVDEDAEENVNGGMPPMGGTYPEDHQLIDPDGPVVMLEYDSEETNGAVRRMHADD